MNMSRFNLPEGDYGMRAAADKMQQKLKEQGVDLGGAAFTAHANKMVAYHDSGRHKNPLNRLPSTESIPKRPSLLSRASNSLPSLGLSKATLPKFSLSKIMGSRKKTSPDTAQRQRPASISSAATPAPTKPTAQRTMSAPAIPKYTLDEMKTAPRPAPQRTQISQMQSNEMFSHQSLDNTAHYQSITPEQHRADALYRLTGEQPPASNPSVARAQRLFSKTNNDDAFRQIRNNPAQYNSLSAGDKAIIGQALGE